MTVEEILKQTIGQLVFDQAVLQAQVATLQKEVQQQAEKVEKLSGKGEPAK